MIKTEQKQIQQDIEVTIECDRCKKLYSKDNYAYQEILRIDFTAGYLSAFEDGYRVQCELCSDCLHQLISDFCRKSEY